MDGICRGYRHVGVLHHPWLCPGAVLCFCDTLVAARTSPCIYAPQAPQSADSHDENVASPPGVAAAVPASIARIGVAASEESLERALSLDCTPAAAEPLLVLDFRADGTPADSILEPSARTRHAFELSHSTLPVARCATRDTVRF